MKNEFTLNNIFDGFDEYLSFKIFKKHKRIMVILKDDRELVKFSENLLIIDPDLNILEFPAWDTFPFDKISPSKILMGKRIFALHNLINEKSNTILLVTISALVQKIPPKSYFYNSSLSIKINQRINQSTIINFLNNNLYLKTATVREQGEFSVRGSIIDVYPLGEEYPKRVDFFGNIIESIKNFDPIDQKTITKIDYLNILRGNEILLNPEYVKTFRLKYRKIFKDSGLNDELYSSVSDSFFTSGLEQYLPLFHKNLQNLFDYAKGFKIVLTKQFKKNLIEKCEEINDLYLSRKLENSFSNKKLIPIDEMYLNENHINEILNEKIVFNIVYSSEFQNKNQFFDYSLKPGIDLSKERSLGESPLDVVLNIIKYEKKVVFTSNTSGSLKRIIRLIKEVSNNGIILPEINQNPFNASFRYCACIYHISRGFRFNEFLFISEEDIFGKKFSKPRSKNKKSENFIRDITSLEVGDLMVHIEHGICKFKGLQTITSNYIEHDCLKLQFSGGDILFLPVENIELISKYGSESNIQLDKLGGLNWQERKAAAKKRIKEIANLLINTAAERSSLNVNPLDINKFSYEEFCSGFEFDETDDQLNAIRDVETDLSSGKIMDRLICGDVGYGKTEIALRASFIVAMSGFQVAIIVPTTLLVKQHFENFLKRFKSFPINVSFLSRFLKGKELHKTKEGISSGDTQIVIGTHSLFSKNINFNNLGLLIIDEEQHFGVSQKELFKQKYKKIHFLSLTATPIPRTLQLSLSGIVNMSLIATPPANRLAIRTFITPWDEVLIKEAIKRELFRGGSMFVVVPRINDIAKIKEQLLSLLPEINISIAHGKMKPNDIDKAMANFLEGKINLLLTTNIIESGLDIKSANTIIIYRADMFGLSQLYQLRGRVGRGQNRAYSYMIISKNEKLTITAQQRLNVMQTLDNLGAGFSLASHDMDIRGAGNLLGEEQSGNIKEVGIELYQKMLNDAVKSGLNNELNFDEDWSTQIKIDIPTKIPETYIEDLSLRLSIYKRISNLQNDEEINEIANELEDRFGKLPNNVKILLEIIAIKIKCKFLNISLLEAGKKGLMIKFNHRKISNPEKLILFFTKLKNVHFRKENSIFIKMNFIDHMNKIEKIKKVLNRLISLL